MLLKEAIEDFFAEQQYKGNRPATLTFYRENFNHFLKDTRITELAELDEQVIRTWLVSHRTLSPNTLSTYDRAIRCLVNWLYSRGYLEVNPMKRMPKPRAKRLEVVTFTAAEIKAILKEAGSRQTPLRDKAMIMLLVDTGLRVGELCNLELRDVQWSENYLTVDGKTGQRQLPFGRKVKQGLKVYIDQERKAANSRVYHVFLNREGLPLRSSSATQRLAKLATYVGVNTSKTGAHIFRHTFAVEYVRGGGDAFTLQRLLGHTTLEMRSGPLKADRPLS